MTEREEILEAALRGLYELVAEYAPVEDGPPGSARLRYIPASEGREHGCSIERELRIAKSALEPEASDG